MSRWLQPETTQCSSHKGRLVSPIKLLDSLSSSQIRFVDVQICGV